MRKPEAEARREPAHRAVVAAAVVPEAPPVPAVKQDHLNPAT